MIHNDVLNQLQLLVKTSVPPLVEVAETPAELPQWTSGQKLPAHVLASLPNGRFQVSVGDQVLDMNLPKNTQLGENIELIYVANQPRLTFVLSRETQASNRANAATAAAAAAEARGDISLSDDAEGGVRTGVTLSDTARFLGALMQKVAGKNNDSQASPLLKTEPLVPAPPANSREFAQVLRGALSQSGLFYESHQAQWVAGERSLTELLHEPQGKLSNANSENSPAAATLKTPLSSNPLPALSSTGDAQGAQVLVKNAAILSAAAAALKILASANPPPGSPSVGDTQRAQVLFRNAAILSSAADTLKTLASPNPLTGSPSVGDARKVQLVVNNAAILSSAADTLRTLASPNPPLGSPSVGNVQKAQVLVNNAAILSSAADTLKTLASPNPPPVLPPVGNAQKTQVSTNNTAMLPSTADTPKILAAPNPLPAPPSVGNAQKVRVLANNATILSSVADTLKTLASPSSLPALPSVGDIQKTQVLIKNAAVLSSVADTLKTWISPSPPVDSPPVGDAQKTPVLVKSAATLSSAADTLKTLLSPNPLPVSPSAEDARKAQTPVKNAAIPFSVADTLKTSVSPNPLPGSPAGGDTQRAQVLANNVAILSFVADTLKTLASPNPSPDTFPALPILPAGSAEILPAADMPKTPASSISSTSSTLPPDLSPSPPVAGDAHKAQVLVNLQADAPSASTGKPMDLVHPDTMPLIQQQLHTLDARQMVWQGQIWPGQSMDWIVEERDGRSGGKDEEAVNWQTRLRLQLPRLGNVSAALAFTPQGLRISLAATETTTAETLKAAQGKLQSSLDAAGLALLGLTVERDEHA